MAASSPSPRIRTRCREAPPDLRAAGAAAAAEPWSGRRAEGSGARAGWSPARSPALPGRSAGLQTRRARALGPGAAASPSTCGRAAFVYGGPAFGRSAGRAGEAAQGEGPRPGRGRGRGGGGESGVRPRRGPPESRARLRLAAPRESPRRDPRASGRGEVAVSAAGAPRGPGPWTHGGARGGATERAGREGCPGRLRGFAARSPAGSAESGRRDPPAKCPVPGGPSPWSVRGSSALAVPKS